MRLSRSLCALLGWRRRPHTVLELGRSRGGTFFLWTRVAAGRATLVSAGPPPWEIDDPGEDLRPAQIDPDTQPAHRRSR